MPFKYVDNQLMAENVPLAKIAAEAGTPVYVYSRAAFTARLDEFNGAFRDIPHLACFAVKTAGVVALLKLAAEKEWGADIVSGGELFKAGRAGIAPARVIYSGVGKTRREMREALEAGILMFNVESEEEMAMLSQVAGEMGKTAPVAVRINPDVDPGTHAYVATGLKTSKFGLAPEPAFELYKSAAADPNLEVVGIACHIGSQLLTAAPFLAAAEKLKDMILKLKAVGVDLKYFDMGGGLGIKYSDETVPPSLAEYAAGLKKVLAGLPGLTLILEPGRYVAGNSAVMLMEVLVNKTNGDRRFVVTTGAMNDLIRPSLYDSYHDILPVVKSGAGEIVVDVVGPVCESSDFLAKDRLLQKVESGDFLAAMGAGAYGFSMSSNYNARPRAAVVLVDGDGYKVIKPRETYEDLICGE